MREAWKESTLGETCEFFNGKAHEKQIDENGKYIVVNSKFISSSGASFKRTSSVLFPLKAGDIVMVMSDVPKGKALAKCFLIDEDEKYSLNQRICCIHSDRFDKKFLFYQLNRHPYLLSFDNKENQTNLRKADILNCPLFIPPREEQKRIVAILDEAFAGIDTAIANTEKNIANARELFESYLNSVITKEGEGWDNKKLRDIATFSQGKQVGIKNQIKEPREGYVRFIRIVDYTQNTDDIRYVLDPGARYIVDEDDIVMVRYGSPGLIGRGIKGVIANNLFQINIEIDALTKDFLALFLMQKPIQNFLSTRGSATMPALNFSHLNGIYVSFPQLSEQKCIVKLIKGSHEETQRLEKIYQQKIISLNELKQSLLQKAFSGELTAEADNPMGEAVA